MNSQAGEEARRGYCAVISCLKDNGQYRIITISTRDALTTVTNAMMVR